MDLAEALNSPPVRPHAGCSVGRALVTLDEEDAAKVRAAFGNVPGAHIARTVKQFFDIDIPGGTWNRHINEGCACDKAGLR